MPLTSKLRIRYQRRVGFPGYSHIEIEVEEEVIMEEGDTPTDVEKAGLQRMGAAVYAEMEPVVDLYRQKNDQPAKPTTTVGAGTHSEKTHELLREAATASRQAHEERQATRQATLPEPPPDLPKDREPQRPMPDYNEQGQRVRGQGQKRFIMDEINLAWQALSDAKLVDTAPDISSNVNTERQTIRVWLKATPLDPKFSQEELSLVVESYAKWRGQGLTTEEAMGEVRNDYLGFYAGATASVDGDAGGGDQEAADSEDEAEPGDQGSGEVPAGPDPDGPGALPGYLDPEAVDDGEAED